MLKILRSHKAAILAITIYVSVLTFLLLTPNSAKLVSSGHDSKGLVAHFLTFMILGALFSLCGFATTRPFPWILVLSYTVLVELLQVFVPHRVVDLLDVCMNLIGLVAGVVFFAYARHVCSKHVKSNPGVESP